MFLFSTVRTLRATAMEKREQFQLHEDSRIEFPIGLSIYYVITVFRAPSPYVFLLKTHCVSFLSAGNRS